MKRIIFCLMVLAAFTTIPAFAGSGHGHGGQDDHGAALSKEEITKKASGYVAMLIEKGSLDVSWQKNPPAEAKENDHHQWMVTFSNPAIEDPGKQTLYMFLTPSGQYIAANYIGP